MPTSAMTRPIGGTDPGSSFLEPEAVWNTGLNAAEAQFAVAKSSLVTIYHPEEVALAPDRMAVISDADGIALTYGELDERANQFAHYLRNAGLRGGDDAVAVLMDNDLHFFEVLSGIERSGASYASVNYDLTASVIRYIVENSGAAVLVTTTRLAGLAATVIGDRPPNLRHVLVVEGHSGEDSDVFAHGFERYQDVVRPMPTSPVDDPNLDGNTWINYTSGSTGLPKSVRFNSSGLALMGSLPTTLVDGMVGDQRTIYLAPSPLYHNLPGMISLLVHRRGGTVVVLRDFAPENVLAAIERYHITHSMMPPSLLVALSKLPAELQHRYSTASLRGVVHDAAPCSPAIKAFMIQWWGSIINEFYGASDAGGATFITSSEWLDHPGSVGRPVVGNLDIRNSDGQPVSAGEVGDIWFGGNSTESEDDSVQWRNTGDVGYRDADGYLYHLDRRSNVVMVDGICYYPEQIEHALIAHPRVADVAVLGLDPESPGELTAVVEPLEWAAVAELSDELTRFCVDQLTAPLAPICIRFIEHLPRAATGKLYRKQIELP